MPAQLKAVSYYLPETVVTNQQLGEQHVDWQMHKVAAKTGIESRHVAGKDEFSIQLAIKAAENLFAEHKLDREDIDFVLFCTQTPEFLLPANACVIHEALGLKKTAGAMDCNQGCSGYVYSLLLAESLISNGRARNVLLITADTYTKLLDQNDRNLVPIFADGASASLVTEAEPNQGILTVEYGTDGSGASQLIAPLSGVKGLVSGEAYQPDLVMQGPAIFNFTLQAIPGMLDRLLEKSRLTLGQVDQFIFHQANAYMLEHLREKIGIDSERFFVHLRDIGNCVSSSIPIALHEAMRQGKVKAGDRVVLVGFGVGLSWAATLIQF